MVGIHLEKKKKTRGRQNAPYSCQIGLEYIEKAEFSCKISNKCDSLQNANELSVSVLTVTCGLQTRSDGGGKERINIIGTFSHIT